MKKILSALAIVAVTAGMCFATVTINWVTANGVDDPSIPGTAVDLAAGSFCQLIWTPTAVIDPINTSDPTTPQGDDILLSVFSIVSPPGGYITAGATTVQNEDAPWNGVDDGFVGGFAYTRVFNTAAPGAGTWYGEGGMSAALNDQDPVSTPNTSDISSTGLYTLTSQIPGVIPEPTTWAFMGIGLLTIAIRRKMRK